MRPVPQRDDVLALRRVAGHAARLQLTGADRDGGRRPGGCPGWRQPDRTTCCGWPTGAAGNPLYVTELVAALARSSSLTITEGRAAELAGGSAPSLPVRSHSGPAGLRGPAGARGAAGGGPARGGLCGDGVWRSSWTADVADLVRAIDEARAAGVLAESGNGLGFRHPLIRAALYDEMPALGACRLAPRRWPCPGSGGRAGGPGGPAAAPCGSRAGRPRPSRWTSGC